MNNRLNQLKVYLFSYNCAFIIGHVIDHYKQFTQDITIIDNYSDDGTRDIIRDSGVKLINDLNKGRNNETILLKQKNSICFDCSRYKGGIIIADADEVLYADNNRSLLDVLNYWIGMGMRIVKPVGYEIISKDLPKPGIQLTSQYKYGVRDVNYDKTILMAHDVKPKFLPGCHKSNPSHPIAIDPTLKLLHFRSVGGYEGLIERYKARWKSQSQENLKHGYGIHYSLSEEEIRDGWNEMNRKKEICVI